jgi:8-oxo-dGTP pyrophosphatase MutT (NUDIX family)
MESELRRALQLDLPYPGWGLRPLGGRPASVLALFAENSLLITRRTETVESHKGQMAFPGGMVEPGEETVAAALRETHEEVGILPTKVRVVGMLPALHTFTGFEMTPVVGLLEGSIEGAELVVNTDEIAEAFWVSLETLRSPGIYRVEQYRVGPLDYPVHVYQVDQYRIWGATAAVIKNILDRLEKAKGELP